MCICSLPISSSSNGDSIAPKSESEKGTQNGGATHQCLALLVHPMLLPVQDSDRSSACASAIDND